MQLGFELDRAFAALRRAEADGVRGLESGELARGLRLGAFETNDGARRVDISCGPGLARQRIRRDGAAGDDQQVAVDRAVLEHDLL